MAESGLDVGCRSLPPILGLAVGVNVSVVASCSDNGNMWAGMSLKLALEGAAEEIGSLISSISSSCNKYRFLLNS